MKTQLITKSDMFKGQLQDIRNRVIEEIKKQSGRIVLTDNNYEIVNKIKLNSGDNEISLMTENIFAVNKEGAAVGTIFDSRTIAYESLPTDQLIELLKSLELTL